MAKYDVRQDQKIDEIVVTGLINIVPKQVGTSGQQVVLVRNGSHIVTLCCKEDAEFLIAGLQKSIELAWLS